MLWFLVAICLSYQASAECPRLTTTIVAELAQEYITCYQTTTALTAETAHDYCECLAGFINGLGGWDCSAEISSWGSSIGSAAFATDINRLVPGRQIGSSIYRAFFGSSNPFMDNAGYASYSSTYFGSVEFGSIGSTFGFASLASSALGGLGDGWATTCADETGWDFVAWLDAHSDAIGYRFRTGQIWGYSPLITNVSFKGITDNNVALTVAWDAGVTTAEKDAFVDSLTFWCWGMVKNWDIMLRHGTIGCFATWEANTINFEVGTNGDVIPPPASSSFHVSLQLPTGSDCTDLVLIAEVVNAFKYLAKASTFVATCDGTDVSNVAKRSAQQATGVLDISGDQTTPSDTYSVYGSVYLAESLQLTTLEASLSTTAAWTDEMSTYSGYTGPDGSSPSSMLICNAIWVVLLITGFIAL